VEIADRIDEINRQRGIIDRDLKVNGCSIEDPQFQFMDSIREDLFIAFGEFILDVAAEPIESARRSALRANQTLDDPFASDHFKTSARWEIKDKARLLENATSLKELLDQNPPPKNQRSIADVVLNGLICELEAVLKWSCEIKDGRCLLITRIIYAYFPAL